MRISAFIIFGLLIIGHGRIYSQQFPDMDSVEFCCEQNNLDSAFYTENFQHILTLELYATKTYCGGKTARVKVKHKEKFVEHSSLIKLHNDLAVKIAVLRAYKNGVKFYLVDVFLFAIHQKRWTEISEHKWEFIQLGKQIPSRYYGERGTKNYYGFNGGFIIY